MAIELIKNNGANVSAPTKTNRNENINGRNFEITLSEVRAVNSSEAIQNVDSVVVNRTLAEFRTRFDSSRDESGVDNERVMRIKQAIENGTYEINPDRIAAKMMQFEFL